MGGGDEHGVGVGHLDGGGDVGNVVGEEGLGGGAAFTVVGVVGGALKAGLPGEDAERGHEDGAERAGGFCVVEADAMGLGQGVGVLPLAGAPWGAPRRRHTGPSERRTYLALVQKR